VLVNSRAHFREGQWAVWNIRDDTILPERYDTSKEGWAAVQEAKRASKL
jgi:hypothetical protein